MPLPAASPDSAHESTYDQLPSLEVWSDPAFVSQVKEKTAAPAGEQPDAEDVTADAELVEELVDPADVEDIPTLVEEREARALEATEVRTVVSWRRAPRSKLQWFLRLLFFVGALSASHHGARADRRVVASGMGSASTLQVPPLEPASMEHPPDLLPAPSPDTGGFHLRSIASVKPSSHPKKALGLRHTPRRPHR